MKKYALFLLLLFLVYVAHGQQDTTYLQPPILPPIEESSPVLPDTPPLQVPNLPDINESDPALPENSVLAIPALPSIGDQSKWFGTRDFSGGINNFIDPLLLSPKEFVNSVNFVPEGILGLSKRSGYQKIFYTNKGSINGMTFADSANSKPHLVVVADDDIYLANSASNWELFDFGNTSAIPTYFAATPFGTVVVNGLDSARIWMGKQPYTGLGVCDTGHCETSAVYSNIYHIREYDDYFETTYVNKGTWIDTTRVTNRQSHRYDDTTITADTITLTDNNKFWEPGYWIGYWIKTSNVPARYRQIVANGIDWLRYEASGTPANDTVYSSNKYYIVCRPDSMVSNQPSVADSGLTFPRGKAVAYFDDRLFVSSAKYPWRIYYSNPRLIHDIDPDAIVNLDLGAFDGIVWMGTFNGFLIVVCKNSIWGIQPSGDLYTATCITKVLGCPAPYTIARGDDYIYLLTDRGVYRWKGNLYGSLSVTMEKISDPVNSTIDRIDPNDWSRIGGYYGDKRYWLSISPDTSLVFDERTNGWYKQGFGFTNALKYSGVFGKSWMETLYPSANGDTNTWSCAGTHWSSLDDYAGTADFIYTATSYKLDKFSFSNTTSFPTGATVDHIIINIYGKCSMYHGGGIYVEYCANEKRYTLLNITSNYWTTSWQWIAGSSYTNPASGLAWTKDDLDSLVLGVYSFTAGATISIASFMVSPVYQNDLGGSTFLFASSSKENIYKYGSGFQDDTTSSGTSVVGIPILASYRSGWFDGDDPMVDKVITRVFWEAQKDAGTVKIYLYKDYSTTPYDSISIVKPGHQADVFDVDPGKSQGNVYQVEIKNYSDVDSLTLKSWSFLLNTLGERKE